MYTIPANVHDLAASESCTSAESVCTCGLNAAPERHATPERHAAAVAAGESGPAPQRQGAEPATADPAPRLRLRGALLDHDDEVASLDAARPLEREALHDARDG